MVGLIVVAALVVSMIRQPEVYTWSGGSTSLGERQNWSVYCLHHRFPPNPRPTHTPSLSTPPRWGLGAVEPGFLDLWWPTKLVVGMERGGGRTL